MVPGEVVIGDEAISLNPKPDPLPEGMPAQMPWRVTVKVRNDGDRPVQVGSHYHFYEVNPGSGERDPDAPPPEGTVGHLPKGLVLIDNSAGDGDGEELSEAEKQRLTAGYRLDIPAGTAQRFEPGDVREVTLVALSGGGNVLGLRTEGTLAGWKWNPAMPPEPGRPILSGEPETGKAAGRDEGEASEDA
jgi:urease beta subunit